MATDPRITKARCATSGSACQCDLSLAIDVTESGTYSTNQTALSVTPAGGGPATSDSYCVQGNELHSISVDMTMPVGPMGMVRIAGDLVYTRQ
jgi:hypothetical protein